MFETQHNVTLKFLSSGDAGTALNKAILSKGNPLADIFYGLDNTFLSRALDEDIFEPYNAPITFFHCRINLSSIVKTGPFQSIMEIFV